MGISYDELWLKSKYFIEKAIKKRDEGDFAEFQLWASITLEMLGKATLAYIHPSLVVDPNTPKGLLIACGYTSTGEYKTITAKTVFERLNNLLNVRRFDTNTKDFCMRLANLRNAELHTGTLPFDGMNIDSWLPKYWDTCKMLLEFQAKTLLDFIGPKEAGMAEEIINNRSITLKRLIESRIQKHKEDIEERYNGFIPKELKDLPLILDDNQSVTTCPSCGCPGLIQGELLDEGPIIYDNDEPWILYQDVTYEVTSFSCRTCGLRLNNLDEIVAAELDHQFENRIEIEPDYEPDYGND